MWQGASTHVMPARGAARSWSAPGLGWSFLSASMVGPTRSLASRSRSQRTPGL